MIKVKFTTCLSLTIILLIIASSTVMAKDDCSYSATSHGNRQFGMDILNTLPNSNYENNLRMLQGLHGSYQHFSINWSSIEASGSVKTSGPLTDPQNYLTTMNAVATSSQSKTMLTLRPIDTTGKTVPADLAGMDFNNPVLIVRFEKMLDFTIAKIGANNLVDVMIGNEVNTYNPGSDQNFWVEYAQFLRAVTKYANQKYPSLKIGFVATFDGFTNSTATTPDGWPAQKVLSTLAQSVNVVGITYYPIQADFSVRPPATATADLARLVSSVPANKPIHITEVGYPSGALNKSSEAMQANFMCEFMHAWDLTANRIPNVSFLRLNDLSQNQAGSMASEYRIKNPAFTDYLRTLGLVNESSIPKPAYYTFADELSKRNF